MSQGTRVTDAAHSLVEGQRLDQPTFHALFEAMPLGTLAELIDGVVSMPSPVGYEHGEAQVPVIMWPGHYAENTSGVMPMDNATTIMGWKSEPQPDGLLRILPECGGRTWIERGFLNGAPELVVEVSKATRYSCPSARIEPGKSAIDSENWAGSHPRASFRQNLYDARRLGKPRVQADDSVWFAHDGWERCDIGLDTLDDRWNVSGRH